MVTTTVGVKGLLNVGVLTHVEFGENELAVVDPVLIIDLEGTNSVQLGSGLEPTKLSAVLVGPSSATVVDIDLGGHNLGVGSGVVVNRGVSRFNFGTNQNSENFGVTETLKTMNFVAEAL